MAKKNILSIYIPVLSDWERKLYSLTAFLCLNIALSVFISTTKDCLTQGNINYKDLIT